jgi:hypothetical protein
VKTYSKSLQESTSQVIFRPKTAKAGFLGCLLREIFACNSVAPRKWSDERVFHATNRGSNVGDHIAKHAACSGDSGSIYRPGFIGQSRSQTLRRILRTCRRNIAYNSLPYNFTRMLLLPLVGGVLHVLLGEASQNGFRFSRPQA